MTIPYWTVILAVIINIFAILINLDGKSNKGTPLSTVSPITPILPRIYFLIIYLSFWVFNMGVDDRSMWGRLGNLAIFTVDSCVLLYLYCRNHKDGIWVYWYIKLQRAKYLWGKFAEYFESWRKT